MRAGSGLDSAGIAAAIALWLALAWRFALALGAGRTDGGAAWLAVPASALGALAGVATADALSGLVHFSCDRFFTENTPLIGKSFIAPFRAHHRDPVGITRHGFRERSGNNCLALVPLLALLHFFFDSDLRAPGRLFQWTWLLVLCVALAATNEIHAWAHATVTPRAVRRLQRWGLLLSPRAHERHHRGHHARAYCITTGWLNPWLDRGRVFDRLESIARGRLLGRTAASPPRRPKRAGG